PARKWTINNNGTVQKRDVRYGPKATSRFRPRVVEPFSRGMFDVVDLSRPLRGGALSQSINGPSRPIFSVSNGRRTLPSAHRGSHRLRHLFVGPIGNCDQLEPRRAALQGLQSR